MEVLVWIFHCTVAIYMYIQGTCGISRLHDGTAKSIIEKCGTYTQTRFSQIILSIFKIPMTVMQETPDVDETEYFKAIRRGDEDDD